MASLMAKFRKGYMAKSEMGSKDQIHSIPSGFNIFDLANASYNNLTNKIEAGIREGHVIGFVGPSGSGKSSLAQQISYMITKMFENSATRVIDAEKSYNKARMFNLYSNGDSTLADRFEDQVGDPINTNTYTDNLIEMINEEHKFKMEHKDELTESYTDYNGDKVSILAPTFYIIDSVSALFAKSAMANIEDGQVDTNMSGSQTAVVNSNFFTKVTNMLFEANINLIVVGHITRRIQIGPVPTKSEKNPYLKPDENIKGGAAWLYICDYLIRINPGTNLDEKKDYGIHGFINDLQILKSRGNESGFHYPAVFDFSRGYNNLLTNVQFLIDNKKITTGAKSFLNSLPDVKFTKATVEKVCAEHPELEEAITSEVVNLFIDRMPKAS